MLLLFDIGGTKTRIALAYQEEVIKESIMLTPKDPNEALDSIIKIYYEFSQNEAITAGAGGFAGVFDANKDTILHASNLPEWNGFSLKSRLEEVLEIPILLENDSSLSGLGEAVYGAGKGYGIVMYITVSTGVGGARIVDRKIDSSHFGFEPGHQYIDFDKSHSTKVLYGTLEKYISGTALRDRYLDEPEDIDNVQVWQEVEELLAYGLINSIVHWSPEVVVLGGGLINSRKIDLQNVTSLVEKNLYIFPEPPVIKLSELHDKSGLYGAIALLQERI